MIYKYGGNNPTEPIPMNIKVDSKWSDYAANTKINTLWNFVDKNRDGIVQENELNLLEKLFQIADSLINKTKGNNIIEEEELNDLISKIENNTLEQYLNKNITGTVSNRNQFVNYSYITENFITKRKSSTTNHDLTIVNVNYDELIETLRQNPDKKYNIIKYKRTKNADGSFTEKPVFVETRPELGGTRTDWSEGTDRIVRVIQLADWNADNQNSGTIMTELQSIGSEMGFDIQVIEGHTWNEDGSILLHDGYRYIVNENIDIESDYIDNAINNTLRVKRGLSVSYQGEPRAKHAGTQYAQYISDTDIVNGCSYLEGGNVLNTRLADGTPAAIVGEETIFYTIQSLIDNGVIPKRNLNDTENIKIAKKHIAEDLHLDEEHVLFIPQLGFHIDMSIRPLHSGQIAIPDYEEAICILQEQGEQLFDNPETAERMLQNLREMNEKTKPIIADIENTLVNAGYQIVKIPCFNIEQEQTDNNENNELPIINFMNAVTGRSSINPNESFYITNTSGNQKLDNIIAEYFNAAGIDHVYFVSTQGFLKLDGGIDCLTQEM